MKDKIIVISFIVYIFIFSGLGIVLKDKEISFTERRKLVNFPEFKLSSDYIEDLDKYFLDHFPFRDDFRSIKASFNYNVLNKLDNNGIYLKDNYIFKTSFKTNTKSLNNFIKHINTTKEYLSSDNKVYMMIIPDKNYYLDTKDFLKIDYDLIYKELDKTNIKNIDIRNVLTLDDFYETDTHWKQEKISKVVDVLSQNMNLNNNLSYKENIFNNFYGVYYSESAIKRNPERLTYLTNDILNNCYVNYLENKDLHTIYNLDNLNSLDAYEVYLDGASSFIEINNLNSQTNKELIIFRDSFASSLTPLLVNNYKKITLIDNRYINSNNYLNLIEFKDQDVLFMYSTLIVNDSFSLKN